ncbi:transposase [Roseomonas sp. OT10]|nr:transposase [Roseomonas sp. OT10]
MFRASLLATWHDLSDVRLAEVPDDRASFRRFCGFARQEPVPERTACVQFRAALVQRKLDRVLFEAVTRQLGRHGLVGRTGTLADATLLPSASIRCDREARWAGHRRRKPTHGTKAHVATDQEASLIRGIEITTANIHDAAELARMLPEAPGDTYGDSAYAGSRPEAVIRARGGTPNPSDHLPLGMLKQPSHFPSRRRPRRGGGRGATTLSHRSGNGFRITGSALGRSCCSRRIFDHSVSSTRPARPAILLP